jgi:hypothetical protein
MEINIPPPAAFLQYPGVPTIRWTQWIRSFHVYLLASGGTKFPSARKAAILLSCVGEEARRVFYAIPDADDSKIEEVETVFSRHYEHRISPTAARHRLRQRVQESGETITSFSSALRLLAVDCSFGDNYEDALTDQFIAGVSDAALRQKLLLTKNLTFERAVEIGEIRAQVNQDAERLVNNHQNFEQTVSRVSFSSKLVKSNTAEGKQCFRCNSNDIWQIVSRVRRAL